MNFRIYQAGEVRDKDIIRLIFEEYLQWANSRVMESFGITFDIKTMLDEDMAKLEKFMPPKGRLLLGDGNGAIAGIVCLRDHGHQIGEIKRMYVRPEFRHQGIGGVLLKRLLDEASSIGYHSVLLDSAKFMKKAHSLYRACGFYEIAPYPGSEIPEGF